MTHGFVSAARASSLAARSPVNGFTLIEMMVALFIFALVAATGVTLLQSSVTAQALVKTRLGGMSDTNRLRAVMTADLAQSAPRPTRDGAGAALPAFVGDSGGFIAVRGGAGDGDAAVPVRLEKVRYALTGGAWGRSVAPTLDGSEFGRATILADDVSAAALRYRGPDGNWQTAWRAADATALPRAVEVTLTRAGRPPLIMRFMTGPAPVPNLDPAA